MHDLILFDEGPDDIIITFNRPEKRNALNYRMRQELFDRLSSLKESRKTIRFKAIGPCFCAGLDIKEDLTESDLQMFRDIISLIRNHTANTSSFIDGTVRGGGVILARSCDEMYATINSNFSIPNLSFSNNQFVKQTLRSFIEEHHLLAALSEDDLPWSAEMALESGLINAISY